MADLWDWSGNLEQLVVKKIWRTKRRGSPAKLKDEKSRKNSRDERRRRKNTTRLVEREDEHKKAQTNQFNQLNL